MSAQEPAPRPTPVAWQSRLRAGRVVALLYLGAATLTMIGTFQNLLTATYTLGDGQQTVIITCWDSRLTSGDSTAVMAQAAPANGVPLLCAVALLLAAAALHLYAPARPGGRRLGTVRGPVAIAVTAFLVATVVTIGAQVTWWLDVFGPPSADATEAPGAQGTTTASIGSGYWMLVAGVGLAVVATVLAWRHNRFEQARTEPDTPRLGIPVVRRLPDTAPE